MKNTWRFGKQEFSYVREVLDSGFGSSTSGSMNNRFESAFAKKIGAKSPEDHPKITPAEGL